jgi:hypothetical protein
MRHHLIVVIVVVMITSLFVSSGYALSINDNGFKWKAASNLEKERVCKFLSAKIGKDYRYWMTTIDELYSTGGESALHLKILDLAALIGATQEDN